MHADVTQLVDHLFRREAGKIVATLTRTFGFQNLHLAEDVVQDALLKAMHTWPFDGVPENPSAWLMRVAKNGALDLVRREQDFRSKEEAIAALLEQRSSAADEPSFADEIRDDQLRMIFACCHPALPRDAQVALTLKTLCGFGEEEIAAAFLSSTAAIAKRLVRARQKIRESAIALTIPAGEELDLRLDAVLQALYLLFNEGYKASQGEVLVRAELCQEAIRLLQLLVEHPAGDQPKAHALLALMLFNAARLATRADAAGNILLLAEQDRTLWDRATIERGLCHLHKSAAGNQISEFHLEAGIASCHCVAATYEATDWPRILSLYDMLVELNHSPVIALHRAVAISHVHGPEEALCAIEAIPGRELLEEYYLFHAIRAQFHFLLGGFEGAAHGFRAASRLTNAKSEQAFLARRLAECEAAQPIASSRTAT